MLNKKTFSFLFLALLVFGLAGCGNQPKANPNLGDAYKAAAEIGQDINSADAVDSERNINNIITMMNYSGNETDIAKLKEVIKQGIAVGKVQGQIDKAVITTSAKDGNNLGTGYMLGYTFGCKAATSDEQKCSKDIGQKYQEIILEEWQKQMPSTAQ